MPSLNYKTRFAPLIESGIKRTTIRLRRKDGRDPKPGQTLYHYTGMRTKKCRRLRVAQCKTVSAIRITQYSCSSSISINRRRVICQALLDLVIGEGFESLSDMLNWFRQTHGPKFSGLLIEW